MSSKQAELFGLKIPSQSWREEIEAAETYWLSPEAIQRCVSRYLAARLDADGEHLLGEKPLKTLRLSQEARSRLLDDFRRLPRSVELAAREWEKWLKGAQPLLSVTFDQETAAENFKSVHLTVTHPLVRQAAGYLDLSNPKYCALAAQSSKVPAGTYHFALYRWAQYGIKPDESLVAVANDVHLEAALFDLLRGASECSGAMTPDGATCDALDARHYAKWSEAQANHMAQNRELAEHRVQSLTASHRARCKAIEDQILRATNEKIRLMKESELARSSADFNRRRSELRLAANSSDVRAIPVVFGTITVMRGKTT